MCLVPSPPPHPLLHLCWVSAVLLSPQPALSSLPPSYPLAPHHSRVSSLPSTHAPVSLYLESPSAPNFPASVHPLSPRLPLKRRALHWLPFSAPTSTGKGLGWGGWVQRVFPGQPLPRLEEGGQAGLGVRKSGWVGTHLSLEVPGHQQRRERAGLLLLPFSDS